MIPPESHIIVEAGAGVEAAIAAAGDAWCLVDPVTKGSPYVYPWTRKGIMGELELTTKCVVESEHQWGLVDQLQ